MCPSYQATGEEEHSTRGRARLLFEMLNGHGDGPIRDGWRSTAVRDALDLCLSCKGCKSDCPADVDMATYKAEFLAHHYEHRLRPRHHYTLGWLPVLANAVTRGHLAGVANAVSHAPLLRRVLPRMAGVEQRDVPLFAGESLQQWWQRRGPRGSAERGTVLLWPDTFTNTFHPHIGQAAVTVLEAAGWQVTMPTEPVCCGLTWISTGQLAMAKKVLRRTIRVLAEHVHNGGLVLGLEPSCTAVFRSDAHELFPDDPDVDRLSDHTVTLAELLTKHTPEWQPPRLSGSPAALAQVHCHQHAIMGWDADADLLSAAGVNVEQLESGCCGLAGNFGFEPGHLQVSEACAESVMLPRIREATSDTLILADGFSCRTQIDELDSGGRRAVHLAEVLAAGLATVDIPERPENAIAPRPERPRAGRPAAVLGAAAAAGLGLRALHRRR
jgi:Fe-S oxidoreductase